MMHGTPTIDHAAGIADAVPGSNRTVRPWHSHAGHLFSHSDTIALVFMVTIPALIEVLFVLVPVVLNVAISFTNWNGVESPADARWVGLENYRYVLTQFTPFWPAAWNNLLWLLVLAVIATPIGIAAAALIDHLGRGTAFYEGALFVPVVLAAALVGVMWELIYAPQGGLLNGVLSVISGHTISTDWYGNPDINIWAAIVEAVWQQVGLVMVIYLAGLKSVDPFLKEAASLDGATGIQTFLRVIWPTLHSINAIVIVITFINALRAFDIVWVINGGTNGLELLNALVVSLLTGQGFNLGTGSAIASILLLMCLIPVVIYLYHEFSAKED